MGSPGSVLRPQPGLRNSFGDIFDDRKRIPDRDVAIDKGGDPAGRGESKNALFVLLPRVERDEDLIEINVVRAQRQPRPHRPGRVVLVAGHKRQSHSKRPSFDLPCHARQQRFKLRGMPVAAADDAWQHSARKGARWLHTGSTSSRLVSLCWNGPCTPLRWSTRPMEATVCRPACIGIARYGSATCSIARPAWWICRSWLHCKTALPSLPRPACSRSAAPWLCCDRPTKHWPLSAPCRSISPPPPRFGKSNASGWF